MIKYDKRENNAVLQWSYLTFKNFQKVPPLSFTKSELASLYQSAVAKGETLKLGTGDDSYIHAAVHELDEGSSINTHEETPTASTSEDSGYYYYYYPIKSFIDQLTSQTGSVRIFNDNLSFFCLFHQHIFFCNETWSFKICPFWKGIGIFRKNAETFNKICVDILKYTSPKQVPKMKKMRS